MIGKSILTSCFIVALSLGSFESAAKSKEKSSTSNAESAFLQQLVGNWQMKGRGRPAKDAPWYRTGSDMKASVRLKDRALVRYVEAPFIKLEALDIFWFDNKANEYTYIYLASNRPEPVIMRGERVSDHEIIVYSEDKSYRTVLRLTDPDTIVAQDFRKDENGEEWMSREVFHYRQK